MQVNRSRYSELFPHGRILVCTPSFFDVCYEINPWMSVKRAPQKARAHQQWTALQHTLLRLGVWLEYVDPQAGLPDMVFTANAGLVRGNKVVLSKFRYKERQGEELLFKEWFDENGYTTIFPRQGYFEGAGDALFAGDVLFAGTGFRSDVEVYEEIGSFLDVKEIVLCELKDPRFYHCDTCFCPLNDKQAIFYPGAFTDESIARMEKHVELLPVSDADSVRFACNAVVVNRTVVLPSGCSSLVKSLAGIGYETIELELDEFMKAGGASKCLTLKI